MFTSHLHLAAIYLIDPTLGTLTNTFKVALGNVFLLALAAIAVMLLIKRHFMMVIETVALAIIVGIFIYVPGFFQAAAQAVAGLV